MVRIVVLDHHGDALVTVDSLTIVVAVLKRAMMLNLPIVLTLTDFLRTVLTDSAGMMG